jgi:hypothetical protein
MKTTLRMILRVYLQNYLFEPYVNAHLFILWAVSPINLYSWRFSVRISGRLPTILIDSLGDFPFFRSNVKVVMTNYFITFFTILAHIPVMPITVVERSEAWRVFARSNTGVVCSNLTQGIDVCVRLFCVWFVLCICRRMNIWKKWFQDEFEKKNFPFR